MTDYDDLFAATAAADSLFADKRALDPLRAPAEIVAREPQQRQLARLLNGVHEGYLPTTVSIYGPPGTGKTITTRRVCGEFAARTESFAYEYVSYPPLKGWACQWTPVRPTRTCRLPLQ